jgi:hypothetical protein
VDIVASVALNLQITTTLIAHEIGHNANAQDLDPDTVSETGILILLSLSILQPLTFHCFSFVAVCGKMQFLATFCTCFSPRALLRSSSGIPHYFVFLSLGLRVLCLTESTKRTTLGLVRDLVPRLSTALPRSWAATDSSLVGDDLLQTESVSCSEGSVETFNFKLGDRYHWGNCDLGLA